MGPLRVGEEFFLAFSPERVDPGRTDWTTRNTPKVIGGVTPACLAVAMAYYRPAIETLVPVSSPDAAEMVKLFENTFRSVNIGLANELLMMCDKLGLDAWEIIEAAATKPFGFMKFTPGPGLGGHCIPIDPLYLSWKLRTVEYNARFIELASEINTAMPRYWVQKVQDALNEAGKAVKGSRILVLGVAYKKNVSDLRESPALDIIHLLEQKGAQVEYHDPHVPSFQHEGMEMTGVADLDTALAAADCVVVATDHADYDLENHCGACYTMGRYASCCDGRAYVRRRLRVCVLRAPCCRTDTNTNTQHVTPYLYSSNPPEVEGNVQCRADGTPFGGCVQRCTGGGAGGGDQRRLRRVGQDERLRRAEVDCARPGADPGAHRTAHGGAGAGPGAHRAAHGGAGAGPDPYRAAGGHLVICAWKSWPRPRCAPNARVEKLALGLDELRSDVENVRSELGGISRTMGYALENEAYRSLPALLEQRHGVRVTDRFVRTEIGGEEINFLAHGVTAEGAAVILVGESKARLDERRGARRSEEKVLETLARKVAAVQAEHTGARIVPLLVTHYARPSFLANAQAQGVIVVQSFEW